MIFVDASALVAILTREPEARALVDRLGHETGRLTSSLAVFEAALAVARKRGVTVEEARRDVLDFVRGAQMTIREIGEEEGFIAIDAHARYGKGRHPAGLNMGDCFAYACAKLSGATLLYKGADFDATDLRSGP
jgi:ribonuclease VapC